MKTVACPRCQRPLALPPDAGGQVFARPSCQARIRVPVAPQPAAPPLPVAALTQPSPAASASTPRAAPTPGPSAFRRNAALAGWGVAALLLVALILVWTSRPGDDDRRAEGNPLAGKDDRPAEKPVTPPTAWPSGVRAEALKPEHNGQKPRVTGVVKGSRLDIDKIVLFFDAPAGLTTHALFIPQNTRNGVFRGFTIGEDYEQTPILSSVRIEDAGRLVQQQIFEWEAKAQRWKGRLPWKEGRTVTVTGKVQITDKTVTVEDATFESASEE